ARRAAPRDDFPGRRRALPAPAPAARRKCAPGRAFSVARASLYRGRMDARVLAPCYVHIGAPKTGSTFLQQVVHDNRAALRPRGLLSPEVSLRGFGHHDLAFLLAGGYPEWATPQPRTLAELAAELDEATQGHAGPVLLSSEDFYLCPAPQRLRA